MPASSPRDAIRAPLGDALEEQLSGVRTPDLKLDASVPVIEVDRRQLQQVVMNLVINGAEASRFTDDHPAGFLQKLILASTLQDAVRSLIEA